MFFKKNKNPKTEQTDEFKNDAPIPNNSPKTMDEVLVELEKIKAQVDAGEELRKVFNEKFSNLDQGIGEFRNMIIERDRDIQTLELKATRASDLVSEIKPEAIQSKVMKFETRIEMLKEKLDANEQVSERIMDELKDIRKTINAFRGIAEIEKLTKEMLSEQSNIKKIQGKIENYADKTESMYLETEKKYEEFRHYKDTVEDLDIKLLNENKNIKELRLKIESEAKKIETEVEKSKKETAKMQTYNDILEELKNINKVQNEQIQKLNQNFTELKKENEQTQNKNTETLNKIHNIMDRIKDALIKK